MQLWASLYTLIKLKGTYITFVHVLFLRKRLSSLPGKRKRKRGGKKVRARALRQHAANENLLTDTTQQPLEFYDSRLSVGCIGGNGPGAIAMRVFQLN